MAGIAGLALPVVVALVVAALVGGVGITAVGPGGVLVTAMLFALTSLSPGAIAGTASATFVATGLLGSVTYARSGELGERVDTATMALFSLGGLGGAVVGSGLNAVVSKRLFGSLLGAFLTLVGALIWYRTRTTLNSERTLSLETDTGRAKVFALGVAVGVPGGLLGVGGPVIAVPLLVIAGVPMLVAVALAQVQSVLLSAGATLGYLSQGAISWPLVALVGIPELVGVVAGWWLAQHTRTERLEHLLAGVLVVIGPALFVA